MNRIITSLLPLLLVVVTGTAHAAEKVWTGSSGSSWSTAANWQPSGVPTSTDDVVFDGTISNAVCSLPSTVVIRNLSVLPSYTGTINGNNNSSSILTITQVMHVSGGSISLGNSRLKVMNQLWVDGGSLVKGAGGICSLIDLRVNGGTFTIGNAPVEILGTFLMENGSFQTGTGAFSVAVSYQQSGGTFSKTGGVGTFSPSGNLSITGGTFNSLASSCTFKTITLSNATFNGGTASLYFNGTVDIQGGSFQKISGAIYMNNNAALSTTNANVNLGAAILNANAIQMNGGSAVLGIGALVVNGNASFTNCTVSKSAGTSNFASATTFSANASTITFGSGIMNIGTLQLTDAAMTCGNGILTVENVFSVSGNSQFVKAGGAAQLSINSEVNISGGSVNLSGCSQINAGNWKQSGGTFTSGASAMLLYSNLELSGDSAVFNAPSSTLNLTGNFRRIGGTFNHNFGVLRMVGTSSFTYSILGNPDFNTLEIINETGVNNKTVEVYGTMNVNQDLVFKNGSAANRSIILNNGTLNVFGNLVIANYRSTSTNPGTATLRFTGSSTQTISGASSVDGVGVLPAIYIDKSGGIFQLNGNVNFGNGFSHQNSTIEFDPEMVFGMTGGNFSVEDLLLPLVRVSGTASLVSSMAVLGNLEVLPNGLFMNGSGALNVSGELINNGRFQNMNGSLNVSSALRNYGEFAANSGSMNALSGIYQEGGIFTCGTGQVNMLSTLTINNGTFNCAGGTVVVSGALTQNGGTLSGNSNGGSLVISQNYNQADGIYEANSGTINIGGSLNLSGTFVRGTGNVNFNGFGPQFIPALYYNKLSIAGSGRLITLAPGEIKIAAQTGGFAPNASNLYTTTGNTINYCRAGNQDVVGFAYNNLTISRSGTKTITANTSVKNTLAVSNSAVFDADGASNNRVFTMISNQSQTARIDQIPATASIVGNMTVQRWTRGGVRSNRFIASPVDTVGGIKFKQIKDNVLLYGPGNTGNGWDNPTLYNTNVFVYNENLANGSEWRSPANTNEVLPKGSGFLIYHLGDRTQTNLQLNTIPNAAVIDFKGVPNQGTIQLPVTCTGGCVPADNGNGWNLVANPYASSIDWDSPQWTKNGISSTIYIWNPRINQYASYNSANPGAATNGGSRYIGPGQGFFMKATADAPALTAYESIKTASFPDTLLFRMAAPQSQLRLNIADLNSETQDEAVIEFREDAKEGLDMYDAYKPALPGMSLSMGLMNENAEAYSVHAFAKPDLTIADKIIPIQLKADVSSYEISASQLSSFDKDVQFYLEDKLAKSITPLEEGKTYTIDVTSDPATSATGRLNLIMSNGRGTTSATTSTSIRVFPNPTSGENVQLMLPTAAKGTLAVYNMLGAQISSRTITTEQTTLQLESMAHLNAGVYTIVWTTNEGRFSERLTIK